MKVLGVVFSMHLQFVDFTTSRHKAHHQLRDIESFVKYLREISLYISNEVAVCRSTNYLQQTMFFVSRFFALDGATLVVTDDVITKI